MQTATNRYPGQNQDYAIKPRFKTTKTRNWNKAETMARADNLEFRAQIDSNDRQALSCHPCNEPNLHDEPPHDTWTPVACNIASGSPPSTHHLPYHFTLAADITTDSIVARAVDSSPELATDRTRPADSAYSFRQSRSTLDSGDPSRQSPVHKAHDAPPFLIRAAACELPRRRTSLTGRNSHP